MLPNKIEIKYPSMREELVGHMVELSSLERQFRHWGGGGVSRLDCAVHFLFDDTKLGIDPIACIGWFLYDNCEAQALGRVVESINKLFQLYGVDMPDRAYLATPEWRDVVESSCKALGCLLSSDTPKVGQ